MRDQHLRSRADHRPLFADRPAARKIERPIEEPRLPRASVEAHAFELDAFIFEIDRIRERGARAFGLELEAPVVIAGDDDFVSMRLFAEPNVEAFDVDDRASTGE